MDALLAQLRRHTDDEPLWQVVADTLSDRGDVRGSMIRLELAIEAARREGSEPRVRSLEREQVERREAHRAALGPVVPRLPHVREHWYGGFLLGFRGWRHGLPRSATDVGRLLELGGHPLLGQLRVTVGTGEDLLSWLQLLGARHLVRLELDLHGSEWDGTFVAGLAGLDALWELQEIGFHPSEPRGIGLWGHDTYEALFDDGLFPELRRIDLSGNRQFARYGAPVLTRARQLCLQSLILAETGLGTPAVEGLARSPVLGSVRCLDLSGNRIGARGVESLVESPHLEHLEVLRLVGCGLTDAHVLRLTEAVLPRLRRLDLRGNRLRGHGPALDPRVEVVVDPPPSPREEGPHERWSGGRIG